MIAVSTTEQKNSKVTVTYLRNGEWKWKTYNLSFFFMLRMLAMTMYSSPKENNVHFQQQHYIFQSVTPLPNDQTQFSCTSHLYSLYAKFSSTNQTPQGIIPTSEATSRQNVY